MTKNDCRQALLQKLHTLPPNKLQHIAHQIWPLLFAHSLWQNADALLAYSSLSDEIDSSLLIKHSLSTGKSVFLPYVGEKNMLFRQIFDAQPPDRHAWGFCQPNENAPLFMRDKFQSVLLIAPAIAARKSGHRLGRGGGFYDRWLAAYQGKINTIVVIAHDFLSDFSTSPLDIPLQYILCEKGLLKSV